MGDFNQQVSGRSRFVLKSASAILSFLISYVTLNKSLPLARSQFLTPEKKGLNQMSKESMKYPQTMSGSVWEKTLSHDGCF